MPVFHLPGMSIRILYFVLASTARLLFKELDDQLENLLLKFGTNMNENQISIDFENWRRRYELVRHYVDQLNNNFGLILLINVIWIFSESTKVFFEFILGYTFLVLISFQFDLPYMISAASLIEFNLHPKHPGLTIAHAFFNSLNYENLKNMHSFNLKAISGLTICLLSFFVIWLRLLVILVPSFFIHLTVGVIQNISQFVHSK